MSDKLIEEYVGKSSWRSNANANWNYSFSGLQSHIAGTILAKDAINKYGKYGKRHSDGSYHIHNLEAGVYGRYCNGNDLLGLLQKGLYNPSGVSAKPAKHFSTALDHVVNMTYILTGEFAGAQAWRDLDILLAPFVDEDDLDYNEVKQELQEMIWSFSFPMRPSFQTPFINLTFGLKPSKYYKELSPVIGGQYKKDATYSDYQDEIDMINEAFLDIMIEGPGDGKPFTFPLPTYNINKTFDWDNDISDSIFELASKWGTPYFANYVNSTMSEEDALSMCCRLRLNLKEVQRVSGGIWNFGSNTGSLAVFTVNLPRIGYMANGNEEKFFNILDTVLRDGKEYLLMKKDYIKKSIKLGLFPMTNSYVGDKLNKTYFLTIGINGLNECSVNFCNEDILTNNVWCENVLKHIAAKVLEFQVETGHLFNFEATPGEGCSYSLARIDTEKFPGIFTQGSENSSYYTGSSLIPSNIEIGIIDALKHQEQLQKHYTGGTVFHIDLGDDSGCGISGIKSMIRATCTHNTLPYITWSPSYSICPVHGKNLGKGNCCEKSEVYSRVVGYYRPVDRWNIGKKEEFKTKQFFKQMKPTDIKQIPYTINENGEVVVE
jgi:ribonucleoside-triphosphate reductase